MGTDIEVRGGDNIAARETAIEAATGSAKLLDQILAASTDPAVQPEKMQAMANLAIQLQDREMQQQFNRDLNAAIMEMPVITKAGRIVIKDKNSGDIVQSTQFAKFEDLDRVVKPIAARHNLAYNFDCGGDDKRLLVKIILRHRNGYVQESSAMPLALETSGSKNNVQGAGSSNTYGKRYVLQNAFAIVTEGEDDDGNLGGTLAAMPQERQNTVLADAEAAHAAGNYGEWFITQSPKDRSWLVASGKHAEFGGPALPPPVAVETREKAKPAAKAEQASKPDPDAEKRANWVSGYIGKVNSMTNLADYALLQEEHRKNLDRFREGYPDLWQQILAAHSAKYDELSRVDEPEPEGEPETKEDLFGGSK